MILIGLLILQSVLFGISAVATTAAWGTDSFEFCLTMTGFTLAFWLISFFSWRESRD